MKKMTIVLALLATLGSNSAFADQENIAVGKGAEMSSQTASNNSFAWGIGLGLLAVIGVVVGVTVASATSSPSSFSH